MDSNLPNAFQLKAHYYPITILKLNDMDLDSIKNQLKIVKQIAPNYFHQSPVVLDFSTLPNSRDVIDLPQLCFLLKQYELIPIGVQGIPNNHEKIAKELNLVVWKAQAEIEKKSVNEKEKHDTIQGASKNKHIITKTVRSGSHIYAHDSDMVILAPVSSGAECLADGDIYCFAPVRGRLLAGARGNSQAHIFCHTLEAELISIDGYYVTYDEYPEIKTGNFQISLNEQNIEILNFTHSK